MGNTQNNKYGQVLIQTDQPQYFSGDQVTGTVNLNILQPGYPGTMVVIKLQASESCIWWEHKNSYVWQTKLKKRFVWYTRRLRGSNIIYSNCVSIHQFQTSTLPQGQYSFPFQFNLDPNIPGSFKKKDWSYEAKIKYTLTATIETSDPQFKDINILHKQPIIVRQPFTLQNNILSGEKQQNIQTWCCIKQGSTILKCQVDRNNYQSGDQAQFQIQLDNSQSKLDVSLIKVQLVQRLTLKTNNGKQIVFSKILTTQQLPGLQIGRIITESNRLIVNLQMLDTQNEKDQTLTPSTSGKNIISEYELVVECKMNGCLCCSQSPKVDLPICIVTSQPIAQEYEKPNNWGPQIYDINSIQFDQSNFMVTNQKDELEQKLMF